MRTDTGFPIALTVGLGLSETPHTARHSTWSVDDRELAADSGRRHHRVVTSCERSGTSSRLRCRALLAVAAIASTVLTGCAASPKSTLVVRFMEPNPGVVADVMKTAGASACKQWNTWPDTFGDHLAELHVLIKKADADATLARVRALHGVTAATISNSSEVNTTPADNGHGVPVPMPCRS